MAKAEAQRMDRKNFIVDGSKVKKLKRVLRTSSESEAIRVAVDRALNAEEAVAALERLRKRGTWVVAAQAQHRIAQQNAEHGGAGAGDGKAGPER